MKFKITIVSILFYIIIFFSTFFFYISHIFGASVVLDPTEGSTLRDNIFGNGTTTSGSAPSFSAFVEGYLPYFLPSLYDEISTSLYQNYGVDLDEFTDGVVGSIADIDSNDSEFKQIAQTLTGGLYDNFASLAAAGYSIWSMESESMKQFYDLYVAGKVDELTGQLTDIYDSALVRMKSGWADFIAQFIPDETTNFSSEVTVVPLTHFKFFGASSTSSQNWTFDTSTPVFLYTNSDQTYVYGCVPYSVTTAGSYTNSRKFDCSCVQESKNMTTGNVTYIRQAYMTLRSYSRVTINNTEYCFGYVEFEGLHNNIFTPVNLPFYSDVVATLNNGAVSGVYDIYDNYLKSLLSQLDGKYLSLDDIDQLLTLLSDLGIDIYSDGTSTRTGVIDVDDTLVGELEGFIEDALDRDRVIAGELDALGFDTSDEAEGEADDKIPSNPKIPSGYFPSFIPDLFPDDMFSMFKPVFDIVGTENSMFDTWMLIPAIFIGVLILYIIVSLL